MYFTDSHHRSRLVRTFTRQTKLGSPTHRGWTRPPHLQTLLRKQKKQKKNKIHQILKLKYRRKQKSQTCLHQTLWNHWDTEKQHHHHHHHLLHFLNHYIIPLHILHHLKNSKVLHHHATQPSHDHRFPCNLTSTPHHNTNITIPRGETKQARLT